MQYGMEGRVDGAFMGEGVEEVNCSRGRLRLVSKGRGRVTETVKTAQCFEEGMFEAGKVGGWVWGGKVSRSDLLRNKGAESGVRFEVKGKKETRGSVGGVNKG